MTEFHFNASKEARFGTFTPLQDYFCCQATTLCARKTLEKYEVYLKNSMSEMFHAQTVGAYAQTRRKTLMHQHKH